MNNLNKRRIAVIRQSFERKKDDDAYRNDVNDIVRLLYTKDDKGRIDLSLGSVFSGKVRPEVRQYVEDNFLRSSMVRGSSCEDADVALENVTPFSMQYGAERDFVTKSVLDRFQKYCSKDKE